MLTPLKIRKIDIRYCVILFCIIIMIFLPLLLFKQSTVQEQNEEANKTIFSYQSYKLQTITPKILPLNGFLQIPELPNGCEATALSIALNYDGCPADKMEIALSYIPRVPFTETEKGLYGGNPENVYVGDPKGFGYYVFEKPVQLAAKKFLQDHHANRTVQDLTGKHFFIFEDLINTGTPIVIWNTLNFEPPIYSKRTWTLYEEETVYQPYSNLHATVIYGYDSFYYYVYDPLVGPRKVLRFLLHTNWEQMGARAIAILRTGQPPVRFFIRP